MIQVLNRALDILEFLSREINKEHGLGEIADGLQLNHSTCANILKTLVTRGYIEKKKGYILGRQSYYLTNNYTNEAEIIKCAEAPMKRLSEVLNESCVLSILKNNSRRTLHKETVIRALQANPKDEISAYQTATGKLLLAYLDLAERKSFIKTNGLPGEGWKEADTEQHLIEELEKIRKAGYAVHFTEEDIVGVAMPILRQQDCIAGLGVYLPENRYTEAMKEKILEELSKTASSISSCILF